MSDRPRPPALESLLQDLTEVVDPASARTVRNLVERWARGRVRVLLLGEAKRGKSTVGNALLRRKILPAGVVPLTAVTTIVRSGSPERVQARLWDGTTRIGEITDLAQFVSEGGNPGNRLGVHEVIVTVASALPHGSVELIDTPGVGSVLTHNTAEAEIAMQSMDVAVLVLTADPPISAAERDLLSRVHSRAARTFVVLNKIDQLDPAERAVAEGFTRRVIAEALDGAAVPLITVSARDAVRAAVTSDETLWRDSGLDALTTVLARQLDRTWRADLTVSIAGDAHLLVTELIDQAMLARRSRDLLATRQADRVTAFRDRLDRLTTRGEDAAAASAAHLARCRAALDQDAAQCLPPLTAAIHQSLDGRLRELSSSSPAALESAGWSAITDLVVDAVTTWRTAWSSRIAVAAADATHRQQQQIDEAVADVRTFAWELLRVDLTADPPVLTLPPGSGFGFDLVPDTGWNQPVTAAVRRHLPGAAGRRRVIRFLHEEVERMLGKHIGRARSDFQIQIHRIDAELRKQADASCAARRAQLLRATHAAEQAAEESTTEESTTDDCSDERLSRLHLLADRLDKLRGTAQPPARDVTP